MLVPHIVESWSVLYVSSSYCRELVCVVCQFLVLSKVGLNCVLVPLIVEGWSDLCVSSSYCRGLVCVVCYR